MNQDACLPTTAWFLSDEHGRPLGQIYRQNAPRVGDEIAGTHAFVSAEVVAFEELRPTCATRRFRVVVRVA